MGAITGAIAWEDYGKDQITPVMKNIWMKTEQHLLEKLENRQHSLICSAKKNEHTHIIAARRVSHVEMQIL